MQYEIFYNLIYPGIKASLEANGVIIRDEYKPATDLAGLAKFAILPMTIPGTLLDINNRIEKMLKEYDIEYTKQLIDFRLPWYQYEVILD